MTVRKYAQFDSLKDVAGIIADKVVRAYVDDMNRALAWREAMQ